jgi:hypothetical protein
MRVRLDVAAVEVERDAERGAFPREQFAQVRVGAGSEVGREPQLAIAADCRLRSA